MYRLKNLFLFFLICIGLVSFQIPINAQPSLPVYVQTGTLLIHEQSPTVLAQSLVSMPQWQGKHYFMLLFTQIPDQARIDQLKGAGLDLIGFLPPHTYLARAAVGFSPNHLTNAGAYGIASMPPIAKIEPALLHPDTNSQLQHKGDKLKVNVVLYRGVSIDTDLLASFGSLLDIIPNSTGDHLLCGWMRPEQILAFAEHPAIQFIEPAPAEGQPEDREGRSLHRSHAIDNQQLGGYRYDGSGIVVGIADDGAIGPHIDFTGRLTQYTTISLPVTHMVTWFQELHWAQPTSIRPKRGWHLGPTCICMALTVTLMFHRPCLTTTRSAQRSRRLPTVR